MKNKDLCIKLINSFREEELGSVAALLQCAKDLVLGGGADAAYTLKMDDAYVSHAAEEEPAVLSIHDIEPENMEVFSVHDYNKTLNMELDFR